MGASNFAIRRQGPSLKQTFAQAVADARHEYGHGGYTGTIAEKDSVVEVAVPTGLTPERFVELVQWMEEDEAASLTPAQRSAVTRANMTFEDKWGPCLAVKLTDGAWLLFGMASE